MNLLRGGVFYNKNSFTLSEVLITLVVIGIVAAITLSVLINNYQKIKVASQVKKIYSTFNQALRMAQIEYGSFLGWEFESSDELFDNYLSKYINTIKVERNVHIHGYFTNGIQFVFQDGTQAICGTVVHNAQKNSCVVFPNSSLLWNNLSEAPKIGYTKPTRQFFWFYIDDNGNFVPPYMNKSREENIRVCKEPGNYGNGYRSCSTILMKDGWEIKEDYPW